VRRERGGMRGRGEERGACDVRGNHGIGSQPVIRLAKHQALHWLIHTYVYLSMKSAHTHRYTSVKYDLCTYTQIYKC
jgi:hypothetical protein